MAHRPYRVGDLLAGAATIARAVINADNMKFDDRGLLPCVVQDQRSGEVLMVAWVNAEAVGLTLSTGELHFWSRSRDEIWHKGATSGNVLAVQELRLDCDSDTLLALVEPAGPACHTGSRACFTPAETAPVSLHEVLPDLERTILQRATELPSGSYTTTLLQDPALAGQKVQEEAEEVTRAAREETDDRVAEEGADLLYHLMVLLRSRGMSLDDVTAVLAARRGGPQR